MNAVRAFWPEPYVDRRRRLVGNLIALRDLAIGRMVPERILNFREPAASRTTPRSTMHYISADPHDLD
jgi:hypothetical protein